MEAPWGLVHLLRQTIVFLKERALRRAMESPRHYELWPRRTRTSSAFRAPGSQRMSSSRSRSSVSMIPRSTSYPNCGSPVSILFCCNSDNTVTPLCNMTHHDLLRAGAGQPNSDEPAEFVTLIERARRWEDGSKIGKERRGLQRPVAFVAGVARPPASVCWRGGRDRRSR